MHFKCSEAAFQASKFWPNQGQMARFCNLDGEAAWRLGRELSKTWTQNQGLQWTKQRLVRMEEILKVKFSDPKLKEILLSTGDAYLLEHIPVKNRDRFWGDDFDGTGENHLGILLMKTRAHFGGHGIVKAPQNIPYKNLIS